MTYARYLVFVAVAMTLFGSACKKDAAQPTGVANVPPAAAPQMIQWNATATGYRAQVGQQITVLCPPGGTPAAVWGSDVYSDDSSICTAGLHSGKITAQMGGLFAIMIVGGQTSYAATSRNGVTTSPYGAWQGSFSIVGGPAPGLVATPVAGGGGGPTNLANAVPIEWSTQGRSIVRSGESQLVYCRPVGRSRAVWGTDVYTSDSSICTAAVHFGVITQMNGGPVQVTAAPGRGGYPASRRNGVRSQSWGAWGASFTVAAPGNGTAGVTPAAGK